MKSTGLDSEALASIIEVDTTADYALISIPEAQSDRLVRLLSLVFRRMYISDAELDSTHLAHGGSKRDLIAMRIPSKPNIKSGDFGEILTAVVQAVRELPDELIDPKKWRYKVDRDQPAPKSDVVQFIMPLFPDSSDHDRLICAEVKTKSTAGATSPIQDAIVSAREDKNGRLVKTLQWLHERATFDAFGDPPLKAIERFREQARHPEASIEYRAVAVVSSELLTSEVAALTSDETNDIDVVVIAVPNLKSQYQEIYQELLDGIEGT